MILSLELSRHILSPEGRVRLSAGHAVLQPSLGVPGGAGNLQRAVAQRPPREEPQSYFARAVE